jgi:tetratricopeptide (TPR) repeat protein
MALMPRPQPFDAEFDFDFRPPTYWPELPSEETVLSQIKGTVRRDLAEGMLKGKPLPSPGVDFVFEESLEDDQREAWGGVHPGMLGGEFLPDYLEGEVEIARVDLASVTSDALQVRARSEGRAIAYRVVDEYETEHGAPSTWAYKLKPTRSVEPLTLGALIDLIDGARRTGMIAYGTEEYDVGLIDGVLNYNYIEGDQDVESLRVFFTVSSAFYPQLGAYYRARMEHWYEGMLLERLDDRVEYELTRTRRALVRPVSPAKYALETLLVSSRQGMRPSNMPRERIVNKLAVERWMRYRAGLDRFELQGRYRRESAWSQTLERVVARWDGPRGEQTIELENRASALLPLLERAPGNGRELLQRDLDDSHIALAERVELALAMRRTRRATDLLRDLKETAPFEAAEFHELLGQSDEAIALYRAASEKSPVEAGWRLLEYGLADEARDLFSRVQGDHHAVLGLAAVARRQGDDTTAVRLYESQANSWFRLR